jgi:hypothetical protein
MSFELEAGPTVATIFVLLKEAFSNIRFRVSVYSGYKTEQKA